MHCDTFHAVAPNCHDQPRLMTTNILVRTEDQAPSVLRLRFIDNVYSVVHAEDRAAEGRVGAD
jgi:hypothetical protein